MNVSKCFSSFYNAPIAFKISLRPKRAVIITTAIPNMFARKLFACWPSRLLRFIAANRKMAMIGRRSPFAN